MKDQKLTDEQRKFAQEHHYVLENFLRYRRLPTDEFYDVVVFRFLRAVQQYDEREDLRQYKFSTVANYAMRSAVSNYFAKEKRRKDNLQMLSLDYRFGKSEFTLGDILADKNQDVCGSVCEKLSRPVKRIRLLHKTPYKNTSLNVLVKEAA